MNEILERIWTLKRPTLKATTPSAELFNSIQKHDSFAYLKWMDQTGTTLQWIIITNWIIIQPTAANIAVITDE